MAEGKLYFTYESSTNLDQMAQHCPDAQVVRPVILKSYELLFHDNLWSVEVTTIAPRKGSMVHDLLWNITPECERSLGYYEGYPHLYRKEPVTVHGYNGWEHTVIVYVMTELCKEPSIPSFCYYNGILGGCQQNELPTASLRQAQEHCVEEIRREIERINRSACGQLSPRQKRDHG